MDSTLIVMFIIGILVGSISNRRRTSQSRVYINPSPRGLPPTSRKPQDQMDLPPTLRDTGHNLPPTLR